MSLQMIVLLVKERRLNAVKSIRKKGNLIVKGVLRFKSFKFRIVT